MIKKGVLTKYSTSTLLRHQVFFIHSLKDNYYNFMQLTSYCKKIRSANKIAHKAKLADILLSGSILYF